MTNHPTCDPFDPETEQRLVDDQEAGAGGKAIASANNYVDPYTRYTYRSLMSS
jgi:hypothetical protein